MTPFLIGIAGPSGSGKTELALRLQATLPDSILMSLDSYYLSQDNLTPEERCLCNFDDPAMLDWDLVSHQVAELAGGTGIDQPIYSFDEHIRLKQTIRVEPSRFLIIEGIFALHHEALRKLFDIRLYVTAPDEVCLARRIERDVAFRGRTAQSVVDQYAARVRPSAEIYVLPTEAFADLTVSGIQPIDFSVDSALEFIETTLAEKQAATGSQKN